jgi:hypothetical protein
VSTDALELPEDVPLFEPLLDPAPVPLPVFDASADDSEPLSLGVPCRISNVSEGSGLRSSSTGASDVVSEGIGSLDSSFASLD